MKILKLDESHHLKLIKLVREFFPKYDDCMFYQTADEECIFFYKNSKKVERPTLLYKIHWYQLCLTELPKRIWEAIINDDNVPEDDEYLFYKYSFDNVEFGKDDIIKHIIAYEHPVDFLWEFIEDCKKHNYFKK